MKLKVSKGNTKLGKIPNVSTLPVKDCGSCDFCKKDCYALRIVKRYPNVKKAWKNNSELFRKDRQAAFEDMNLWLGENHPEKFRIHVGGDFLDQDHVYWWSRIASRHPWTKFLAFTKMHHLNFSYMPDNLTIVLSMFPGMPLPDSDLPKAWLEEERVPEDAFECTKSCSDCFFCWYMEDGENVYFHKH
jgi:hypothetical protein